MGPGGSRDKSINLYQTTRRHFPKMGPGESRKKSINLYQTTRRHIPKMGPVGCCEKSINLYQSTQRQGYLYNALDSPSSYSTRCGNFVFLCCNSRPKFNFPSTSTLLLPRSVSLSFGRSQPPSFYPWTRTLSPVCTFCAINCICMFSPALIYLLSSPPTKFPPTQLRSCCVAAIFPHSLRFATITRGRTDATTCGFSSDR